MNKGLFKKRERRVSFLAFLLSGFFLCAATIVFNFWLVEMFLIRNEPLFFLESYRNYNFAFSLPLPKPLIYIIYGIVIWLLVDFVLKNGKTFSSSLRIAWLLVFCGAFINISERLLLGYVRDYFHFWRGYFNLADIYISLGLAIMFILSMKNKSEI